MSPESTDKTILFVAGEPSGDQAAAHVVRALRERHPSWRLLAVGGARMREAGAEIILPNDEVAVMGFTEVVKHLPALRGHLNGLKRMLASGEVDLIIPVDFPGFNLRLARTARKHGVPVLYFIAPQVWAWHKSRVRTMRRDIDRLALILPFETSWFAAEGVPGVFVGHPIMENHCPIAPEIPSRTVALMPGSRRQEVERLLPVFLRTAEIMAGKDAELRFELLASPLLETSLYRDLLAACPLSIDMRSGSCSDFLADKCAAIVASGTATLETAISGVPMAVAYRTSGFNYWLASKLVSLENIALVNLVAERRVVPEFIQGDVRPESMAEQLLVLYRPGEERQRQLSAFGEIRQRLGGPGCGVNVAELAASLIGDRNE
ncbi:MAG: lipid-A-disaccharide synthase [bacterium]|nr:lipid-A-disaccharide synthase [bacterium]